MVLSRKKLIKLIVAVVIGITFFSYVYSIRDGTINEDVKIYFHKISVYIKDVLKPKTKTLVQKSVLKEESMVIDVVEGVSPSVVSIIVETLIFDPFTGPSATEEGIGTGFIVDPTGIVVTNSHVVENSTVDYKVVLNDGTTYDVTKVHRDATTDLAILEINARSLPTVELGDSDELKVGQVAIAIGNALGKYSNTVTTGVISGLTRQITASRGYGIGAKTYEDVIQTDAALNPGNSGGPLLNSAGQVVGINVATTSGADNIGFAIAVNTLKPILTSFLEEGRIVKPYLGVSYSIITEDISKLRDFPEGAFVSRVLKDTPAEKAGIKRGDIITAIEEDQVNSENSLAKVVSKHKVGEEIRITVDRDGESLELSATLEEAPGE